MANNNGKGRHVYKTSESDDWLVNHHRANLVRLVANAPPSILLRRINLGEDGSFRKIGGPTGFRVDFAELQRMKMRKLQIKLIHHAATMAKTGKEPAKSKKRRRKGKEPAKPATSHESDGESTQNGSEEGSSTTWEDDLEAYVKAVRDYDYMVGFAGETHDPFVASSEHRVDHKILEDEMHNTGIDFGFLTDQVDFQNNGVRQIFILPTGPWDAEDSPIWGGRYLKPVQKWSIRLGTLIIAYTYTIVPGALIVAASLASGSDGTLLPFVLLAVFVAIWAGFMVFVAAEAKDVVTMTAGYTAVLGIILNGAAALRESREDAGVIP